MGYVHSGSSDRSTKAKWSDTWETSVGTQKPLKPGTISWTWGHILQLLLPCDLVRFHRGRLISWLGTSHVICLIEGTSLWIYLYPWFHEECVYDYIYNFFHTTMLIPTCFCYTCTIFNLEIVIDILLPLIFVVKIIVLCIF